MVYSSGWCSVWIDCWSVDSHCSTRLGIPTCVVAVVVAEIILAILVVLVILGIAGICACISCKVGVRIRVIHVIVIIWSLGSQVGVCVAVCILVWIWICILICICVLIIVILDLCLGLRLGICIQVIISALISCLNLIIVLLDKPLLPVSTIALSVYYVNYGGTPCDDK